MAGLGGVSIWRRKVHYQAPPAASLAAEMERFLFWANASTPEPALLKAGVAHLWFVTLLPFDDGKGRIARAVGDLFLARADGSPQRFYSLSAQIQRERKDYYDILERTQKGTLDVVGAEIFISFSFRSFQTVTSARPTASTGLFLA